MGITRRLPNSNQSRNTALRRAAEKQASVPVGNQFLTAQTATRLAAIRPAYQTAMNLVMQREGEQSYAVKLKNDKKQELENFVKSYLDQVFAGVRMGKIPAARKPWWGLEVDSNAYPPMFSEDELRTAADNLIAGDASWVASGGAVFAWPTVAEVETLRDDFAAEFLAVSAAKEALDTAMEAVDALTPEAAGVIKKVWDEVETRYNEEDGPSMRANAREWGVVYVTTVGKTTVEATVVNSVTGLPEPGARFEHLSTGEEAFADENGVLNHAFEATEETGTLRVSEVGFVNQDFEAMFAPNTTVSLGQIRLVPG